jgi:hypothetical protein
VEQYDTDKDGKIAGNELNACPVLKYLDKGDGVTAELIEGQIKRWQESRLGRTGCMCAVHRKGKPLADATVKYVPEKFLGDAVPAAVGKTEASGIAEMEIPQVAPPGVALGFYRVEITKEGADIPAKYNTETTLSAAVNGGSVGPSATFNLEY